jgi:UDPglucose--hexose-1-phosphate uridylyltransferase
MSQRRQNLLTGDWVLVSPHRSKRPWQGQVEPKPPAELPSYDATCYLCPGNERAGGHRNPQYDSCFVFENDFAALLPDAEAERASDAPFPTETAGGICRVLCFSPNHSLTLSHLSEQAMDPVVAMWQEQTQELFGRPSIQSVQIFENRGAMMGSSNPHPHGQVWATDFIPPELERECASQSAQPGLLAQYLNRELELNERLVLSNDHWVTLVPYWAVWPFETLVAPRRAFPRLTDMDCAEATGLNRILRELTRVYDALFQVPFPYTMGFHQAPKGHQRHFHLHAHFYPPLLRSADVKKFMVGFEMLAMPQRDITAESAAARLREISAALDPQSP